MVRNDQPEEIPMTPRPVAEALPARDKILLHLALGLILTLAAFTAALSPALARPTAYQPQDLQRQPLLFGGGVFGFGGGEAF